MRHCLNPVDPICRKGCAGNAPCDYSSRLEVDRCLEMSARRSLDGDEDGAVILTLAARLMQKHEALKRHRAQQVQSEFEWIARIQQFQFCINRVAEALGNVCCGGVDSSPENQLADPHSTTRVLCDAIRALQTTRQQWYGDANGTFQQIPVMIIDKSAPILKQMNAVQCPRCYRIVTESCGPNCAFRRTESGEDELKRLRAEADEQDFCESLKNRDGL